MSKLARCGILSASRVLINCANRLLSSAWRKAQQLPLDRRRELPTPRLHVLAHFVCACACGHAGLAIAIEGLQAASSHVFHSNERVSIFCLLVDYGLKRVGDCLLVVV